MTSVKKKKNNPEKISKNNLVYKIFEFIVDTINYIFFYGNKDSYFYKDFLKFKKIHESSFEFNRASLKISIFICLYFFFLSYILELNKNMTKKINVCDFGRSDIFGNLTNLIDMSSLKYVFFHIFFPPSVFFGNFLDPEKSLVNPSTIFFIQIFISYTDKPTKLKICQKEDEDTSNEDTSKKDEQDEEKECYDINLRPKPCQVINTLSTLGLYILYYYLNRYILKKLLNFFPNYIYDFSKRIFSEKASKKLSKIFSKTIEFILKTSDNIAYYYLIFVNYWFMMTILLSVQLKEFGGYWLLKSIFGEESPKYVVQGLIVIMNIIFIIVFFGLRILLNYVYSEIRQIFFDTYGQMNKKLKQIENKLQNYELEKS